MSYTHSGATPVTITKHPFDPDGTDWVYFVYEDWLRTDETIIEHAAFVTGCEIVTDSVHIGTMTDETGVDHDDVYGVQVKPLEGYTELSVRHRVSTETVGALDLGRLDIDRTVIIAIEEL
jgi:hypothetical protein